VGTRAQWGDAILDPVTWPEEQNAERAAAHKTWIYVIIKPRG